MTAVQLIDTLLFLHNDARDTIKTDIKMPLKLFFISCILPSLSQQCE